MTIQGIRKTILIIFIFLFMFGISKSGAQSGIFKKFISLRSPEKIWILKHPFIARKAYKITQEVQRISNEMIKDTTLDGDYSGGQVDAFRHALWMSSLTIKIGSKKAHSLGVAHEKSNRIDYEKRKLEELHVPDSISSAMDLKNNDIGIKIGMENTSCTQPELIEIVKKAVIMGKLVVIKKDKNRNFLDWEGNKIDDTKWQGKWYNPKILVPSDQSSK
jgi:hypothetical protein